MDDIRRIKELRKKLGITQHQLAKMAGVSQSLVAKVEAGSIDPAYSKVKKIIEVLQREHYSKEKAAKEIMNAGVKTVSSSEPLSSAATKMRKYSISQMPVMQGKQVIGSISEQAILSNFSTDAKKIARMKVHDAMEEAFPTALLTTPISAIAYLLRHHSAVLVMQKGKIAGIITKADLLKTI